MTTPSIFDPSSAVQDPKGVRAAIDPFDPGHQIYRQAREQHRRVYVSLNGMHQNFAIMADESTGVVRRYRTHSVIGKGKSTVRLSDGEIEQEDVYGRVRIIIGEPASSFAEGLPVLR